MKRIACVGDSITWGFTILNRRKYSYPALLQQQLGDKYEVRNFGYNDAAARFDADTPYVKKRVFQDSLAWNPDVVLLMLGSYAPLKSASHTREGPIAFPECMHSASFAYLNSYSSSSNWKITSRVFLKYQHFSRQVR